MIANNDEGKETPGIGHNAPDDPFSQSKARVDDLIEAANKWTNTVEEITSEDQAGRASDFRNQLRSMKSKVDGERLETTKPLRDETAVINGQYGDLTELLDRGANKLAELLEPYLRKVAAEQAAREKAARDEADRLAREAAEKAAEAAKGDGDTIQNEIAAERAEKQAEDAQKTANRVGREKASVKGSFSTRSTGMRGQWKATEIMDMGKAAAYYADHPKLTEVLLSIASTDARGGRRQIPGFKVERVQSVG
jgi:hypothetical protein